MDEKGISLLEISIALLITLTLITSAISIISNTLKNIAKDSVLDDFSYITNEISNSKIIELNADKTGVIEFPTQELKGRIINRNLLSYYMGGGYLLGVYTPPKSMQFSVAELKNKLRDNFASWEDGKIFFNGNEIKQEVIGYTKHKENDILYMVKINTLPTSPMEFSMFNVILNGEVCDSEIILSQNMSDDIVFHWFESGNIYQRHLKIKSNNTSDEVNFQIPGDGFFVANKTIYATLLNFAGKYIDIELIGYNKEKKEQTTINKRFFVELKNS